MTAKILFIEDDVGKRYVIARQLRSEGFSVDEATTGQEGLDKLTPDHDVVVCDIRLPDMLGWDVVDKIKRNPKLGQTMVLELSATLATAQDRAKGLDRGADAYLVHPVEIVELVAVIRALMRLRNAERDRTRERELLLATVGHDLRNPLGTLATGVAVLEASTTLGAHERDVVARLRRSTAKMSRLLDQLLLFSQVMGGALPMELGHALLAEICREVVRDVERGEREVHIVDELPEQIAVDRSRIGQVVENLVTNALKHGEGTVTVRVRRDANDAVLSVHNHGAPIDPSALPTLFDPYRRGRTRSDGLGLGLFIVERVVRAHGGTVAVTSTADAGTTFEVRLPIA